MLLTINATRVEPVPEVFPPPAPLDAEWAVTDDADSTGLTFSILSVPSHVNALTNGIVTVTRSGFPDLTLEVPPVVGDYDLGVDYAPLNVAVGVSFAWEDDVSVGPSSTVRTRTATPAANKIAWVPSGADNSVPANWTSRWGNTITYTNQVAVADPVEPARLEITAGSGPFLSLDSNEGISLATVAGEVDFSVQFVPAADGYIEAGVVFWGTGSSAADRQGYVVTFRNTSSLNQILFGSHTAGGSLTAITTVSAPYVNAVGAEVRWSLKARVRQEGAQYRVQAKFWPNAVEEPATWRIDTLFTPALPTSGKVGIYSRNASSRTFGVTVFNLGINGAEAPGAAAGGETPGGVFNPATTLYLDPVTGIDGAGRGTQAAPIKTMPSSAVAGTAIYARGALPPFVAPTGGTPAAPIRVIGNHTPWTGGTNAGVTTGASMGTFTSLGGGIWSAALPRASWDYTTKTGTKPNLPDSVFIRNEDFLRVAQYPYRTSVATDGLVKTWFPIHSSATLTNSVTVPTTLVSAIADTTTRTQIQADYGYLGTGATIRDVINAMHAVEPLTLHAWVVIHGAHNSAYEARISAYNTTTGVITTTDALDPYPTATNVWFCIQNHLSGLRVDGQYRLGFLVDNTMLLRTDTNPNGAIGYCLQGTHLINATIPNVRIKGFDLSRIRCIGTGDGPVKMHKGTKVAVENVHVTDCNIKLCAATEAAIRTEVPTNCVIARNVIRRVKGKGIGLYFGNKTAVVKNDVRDTSSTGITLVSTIDCAYVGNIVGTPWGIHANGTSVYNTSGPNVRLDMIDNTILMSDMVESVSNAFTLHNMKGCKVALNRVVSVNNAGIIQWNKNDARIYADGANIWANNTAFAWGPAVTAQNGFSLTSRGHPAGRVFNNLVSALHMDAFEDSTVTYDHPSFAWREVSAMSGTTSNVTRTSVVRSSTSTDKNITQTPFHGVPVGANLVFTASNGVVTIPITGGEGPDWSSMPAGAGVEFSIDIKQGLTRPMPSVLCEVVATTNSGSLPTLTGSITLDASTTSWKTSLTIEVPGAAGVTVTGVEVRLRPGAGWAAGTADTVQVARPRAWRRNSRALAQRGRNLILYPSSSGGTIGARDVQRTTMTPLKQMVGPAFAQFDFAPRETNPGVLAEPALATGDSWVLTHALDPSWSGVTLNWIGAVPPSGISPINVEAVNWCGLYLTAA